MEATDPDTLAIELPEYDLRRLATARDPHAVMEGYKTEIMLRLASVLGVRMCPQCPRCNDGVFGCQDKFGRSMRPGGGVLGVSQLSVAEQSTRAMARPTCTQRFTSLALIRTTL